MVLDKSLESREGRRGGRQKSVQERCQDPGTAGGYRKRQQKERRETGLGMTILLAING